MTTVSLQMVAAGEAVFRSRCADSFRGFAPSKAECEAAAIAIYAAMRAASRSPTAESGDAQGQQP
jgi:hypothetical protein